jgi:hypothetical protein
MSSRASSSSTTDRSSLTSSSSLSYQVNKLNTRRRDNDWMLAGHGNEVVLSKTRNGGKGHPNLNVRLFGEDFEDNAEQFHECAHTRALEPSHFTHASNKFCKKYVPAGRFISINEPEIGNCGPAMTFTRYWCRS